MFLNALLEHNSALVNAAFQLHQTGQLLPDTYIVDLDAFDENAQQLKQAAVESDIKLYAMTKQFGRNPFLARRLLEKHDFDGIVCVDFKEARLFHQHGIPIAHIGHLVQPPQAMIREVVEEIQPEVITVTSIKTAKEIGEAATRFGRTQAVLLKFYRDDDMLYVNQESGFPLNDLVSVVTEIEQISGLTIAGVTHFPCFLIAGEEAKTTPNAETLKLAVNGLKAMGYKPWHINVPSLNCVKTIPHIADLGGTHAEPGHALTGTTPYNALMEAQPEKIALIYLSEVSHQFEQHCYCFGGGYYRRGNLSHALVQTHALERTQEQVAVFNDDPSSIDYHLRLEKKLPVGSPVIMACRTQVFVTRSDLAIVEGIQSGKPELIGLYDAVGTQLSMRS